MANIYRHSALRCLQCDNTLDASGSPDGSDIAEPEDGDFTVCLRCGAAMRYEIKRKGRKRIARLAAVTAADLGKAHPDCVQALVKVHQAVFRVIWAGAKRQ